MPEVERQPNEKAAGDAGDQPQDRPGDEERRVRRAASLRENLRRRKEQARARAQPGAGESEQPV